MFLIEISIYVVCVFILKIVRNQMWTVYEKIATLPDFFLVA